MAALIPGPVEVVGGNQGSRIRAAAPAPARASVSPSARSFARRRLGGAGSTRVIVTGERVFLNRHAQCKSAVPSHITSTHIHKRQPRACTLLSMPRQLFSCATPSVIQKPLRQCCLLRRGVASGLVDSQLDWFLSDGGGHLAAIYWAMASCTGHILPHMLRCRWCLRRLAPAVFRSAARLSGSAILTTGVLSQRRGNVADLMGARMPSQRTIGRRTYGGPITVLAAGCCLCQSGGRGRR